MLKLFLLKKTFMGDFMTFNTWGKNSIYWNLISLFLDFSQLCWLNLLLFIYEEILKHGPWSPVQCLSALLYTDDETDDDDDNADN